MKKSLIIGMLSVLAGLNAAGQKRIIIPPIKGDATPAVLEALRQAAQNDIQIVFSTGVYHFRPDYAEGRYCFITNHGNGYKKIAMPLNNRNRVEIDGQGAELIFHGMIIPFLIENCSEVTIRNLSIDWDIPFLLQANVTAVNEDEGWYDAVLEKDGFSWQVQKDRLLFPEIDGFSFAVPGCSLAFDAERRAPLYGSSYYDFQSIPSRVEARENGTVRFYDRLRAYPPVGSVIVSKGGREEDRYGPAFHVKSSRDTVFENVTVHHALGMGFLFERSDNARLSGCVVGLKEGTKRLVSTTADATHFCNCKGEILVENCRFENMLDDGTNVHGTYVEVDRILNEKTIRVELKHFEQLGFEFAAEGDETWFIQQPVMDRAATGYVSHVERVNDRFMDLVFREKLPAGLAAGDLLENKTWNPEFVMRGCTIQKHRARNIVLKTPKKTVIENNTFSSMMAAVLFRGESRFWFESGAVGDVLIRNNRFKDCVYGGKNQAVLLISPRFGKHFSETGYYDRSIRFENNTIETFDSHIVVADRVDGLLIAGNKIIQSTTYEPFNPDAHLIELTHCSDVVIEGNRYEGNHTKTVLVDAETQENINIKNNEGF